MEQVFEVVNRLLVLDERTRRRNLRMRTYMVVPLSSSVAVLEFVKGTQALGDVIEHAYKKHMPDKGQFQGVGRGDLRSLENSSRKHDMARKREIYDRNVGRLPPALHYHFLDRFKDADDWFEARQIYTRSSAVTSIVGYVLGVGDRHLSNIMMDIDRGELVMIDLGIAFDAVRPFAPGCRLCADM